MCVCVCVCVCVRAYVCVCECDCVIDMYFVLHVCTLANHCTRTAHSSQVGYSRRGHTIYHFSVRYFNKSENILR